MDDFFSYAWLISGPLLFYLYDSNKWTFDEIFRPESRLVQAILIVILMTPPLLIFSQDLVTEFNYKAYKVLPAFGFLLLCFIWTRYFYLTRVRLAQKNK